jgi:regulator of telomere elongation helicase 1
MYNLMINNINVQFPHEPYSVQSNFMSKIIFGLQTRANCLLESPTGTGKTLSLLCAVLAWRQEWIERDKLLQLIHNKTDQSIQQTNNQQIVQQIKQIDLAISSSPDKEDWSKTPKIYFASRTHTQLSNAVKELKRTNYIPKVALLASRDQLCINPEVIKAPSNTARSTACRQKVLKRTCQFYNNVANAKTATTNTQMPDIEDIVKFGQQHQACPYYLSREGMEEAEYVYSSSLTLLASLFCPTIT